ncbi:hypothetical protein V6N12_038863 [Hibiscus sabdariffa]|uniref:Uncharacterized protein n=1 Tax=Hibiscus sabdariffa TaxID=183260 RepID=A0ABR2E0M9_9ROSI
MVVGIVGMDESGGRAPGLGNDGKLGNVGMLGSGGNVGNDGRVTPGKVDGIWSRWRAASPTLMFDNDRAMKMAKTKILEDVICADLELCRVYLRLELMVCDFERGKQGHSWGIYIAWKRLLITGWKKNRVVPNVLVVHLLIDVGIKIFVKCSCVVWLDRSYLKAFLS